MKIYQATPDLNRKNQFVQSLIQGMSSLFHDISWGYGIDTFWSEEIFEFDIIHIHWPHILVDNHHSASNLEDRLQKIKNHNIWIYSTCHNFEPHYCEDDNLIRSYAITYSCSDVILHLGSYSQKLFNQLYPHSKNLILQHHTYDQIYNNFPSKKECSRKLNLNPKAKYILCFGAFRDNEERKLVLRIANHFRFQNIYILAPSFKTIRGKNKYIRYAKWLWMKYIHHIILTGYSNHPVSSEQLPFYYGIADIAFIQRKKILNSGNVPLAFHFSKVVVGPNTGNVGELLTATHNPTFDINDDSTINNAIIEGLHLSSGNLGSLNKAYAQEHLSTEKIAKQLHSYYIQTLLQH